ncbi:AraC family transcriptional regulator [Streptomyces sp. NPDC058459]|uniref:AraC family transcriptional regulator n=1 Tax=Streptomyces sp. NPDC058459 TaxID=3346508 RepID=UPI00365B91EB
MTHSRQELRSQPFQPHRSRAWSSPRRRRAPHLNPIPVQNPGGRRSPAWRVGEGQAFDTIETVARRWGIVDMSKFSRSFRSAYGMTPRDWRNLHRDRRI